MSDKPDILSTIRAEGFELKQRGRNFWACCPFHAEKTPSFAVNPEWQTFKCFGCDKSGDVISFIQQFKNISFKDACKHLGIYNGKPSPEALLRIKQQRHKSELVRQFRAWESDYHGELADLYRGLQTAKDMVQTIADAEFLSWAYHAEPCWINQLDILEGRDDSAKFEIYCEVNGNGK